MYLYVCMDLCINQTAPPMTTAELMAGSGMKFVHATKRGQQGIEGDLEKSRKKLLEFGFVDKTNLEVDPESGTSLRFQFEKTLEENETLQEYKKINEKTQNESGKAFDEWIALKQLKDHAVKYLADIAVPQLPPDDEYIVGATRAESKSNIKTVIYRDPAVADCIEFGKSMKRVDRSLFPEWSKWCAEIIPVSNASILWDSFFPKSCDVHSVLGSQVRETFLRILKPGLNVKETFKRFAEQKLQRREKNEGMQYRGEDRTKQLNEMSLTRKEMTQLLLDIGVSMKPYEINALIDAFDENGDGVVSMQEFIAFAGPRRAMNAGALSSLSQKCCFRTTCKKVDFILFYFIRSDILD